MLHLLSFKIQNNIKQKGIVDTKTNLLSVIFLNDTKGSASGYIFVNNNDKMIINLLLLYY